MSNESLTRLNLVNISEAYELIKTVIASQLNNKFDKHMNIYLSGSPGLGKSAIVRQISEELDMDLIDLRLSAMEESAVLGVPYVSNGVMDFSTPAWWKGKLDVSNPKPTILFLDELSSAHPSTQTAAYRLVLDRSIQNGQILPDNVFIIAAGNLKSDKTGARDPLPALANRFGMHLTIDKSRSFTPFMDWAYSQKFDIKLLAFLEWSPASVYGTIGDEVAYATPRTIEDVNTHLNTFDSDYFLNIAIAGAVGSEWAHKFAGFRETFGKLPDYERIKAGDKKYSYKKPDDGDIAIDFAIALTMAQQFIELFGNPDTRKDSEVIEQAESLVYVLDMIDRDLHVIFLRSLKRDVRALMASRVVPAIDKMFMTVTDRNV